MKVRTEDAKANSYRINLKDLSKSAGNYYQFYKPSTDNDRNKI